jgi:hypothetical protein
VDAAGRAGRGKVGSDQNDFGWVGVEEEVVVVDDLEVVDEWLAEVGVVWVLVVDVDVLVREGRGSEGPASAFMSASFVPAFASLALLDWPNPKPRATGGQSRRARQLARGGVSASSAPAQAAVTSNSRKCAIQGGRVLVLQGFSSGTYGMQADVLDRSACCLGNGMIKS